MKFQSKAISEKNPLITNPLITKMWSDVINSSLLDPNYGKKPYHLPDKPNYTQESLYETVDNETRGKPALMLSSMNES